MNVQNLIICDSKVIYDILVEIKDNLNCNLLFKTNHEISNINNLENYLILTDKNAKFPFHDDTPNKLLSGVIYLTPEKNSGTVFSNSRKGTNSEKVDWKQNRAVFFSRKERETWHAYEGDGVSNRLALVYNLNSNRLKEVYKAENKNYFYGNLRYKLNPYLYQYLKFTI